MAKVLEQEYVFGETIFMREQPPVLLRRATAKADGKPYLVKIWKIYSNGAETFNYPERFDWENSIFREVSK